MKTKNKILISKKSTIFVLSPTYFKTGGTELLHQYVSVLNKNGFDARITYAKATPEKNINEAFLIYTDRYYSLDEVIDDKNNVLIVPEIYTCYLSQFKKIKKIIWWESVDNYLFQVSPNFCIKYKNYGEAIKVFCNNIVRKNKNMSLRQLKRIDYHFVQSHYAYDFLAKKKIDKGNVFYVSDYINDIYLTNAIDYENKEDIVLYNPKKGFRFTKKILAADHTHTYVPLVNLTNKEVFNLMNKAKVYIDFGNHPGKDRFPREAAKCGCCVITNNNGSAGFSNDLPIPDSYKFHMKTRNIKRIVKRIDYCLSDYSEAIKDFSLYRAFIDKEKKSFFADVLNCYEVK